MNQRAARLVAAVLTAAALIPAAAGVQAQALPESPIPAMLAEAMPGLRQVGTGTFRWFGLKIYDAALWAQGGPPGFTQPFALSLRYARSLKGVAIAQRSIAEIESLSIGTPDKRRAWLQAMEKLIPDVTEGSTLTGLHLPGQGARFFHDGKPLGAVADPEFSRAFFSIWLDPATSAPELRAALLGGR